MQGGVAKSRFIRRRNARNVGPGTGRGTLAIAIVALELFAAMALLGAPLPNSRVQQVFPSPLPSYPNLPGGQGDLSTFVQYAVTFTCYNGHIYLATKGDPSLCSDGTGAAYFYAGSYILGEYPDTGYQFSKWVPSGSVSMSGSTMTVSGNGGVTAKFSGCAGPSITSAPPPKVQDGYRQTWVNWSYSGGTGSLTPGFSWSVGSTTLSNPAFSGGSGASSVNLNDLTAGTTYDYTVSVTDSCGNVANKSGSFSTASSMLTIDGSSVNFQSGVTSVSTTLSTNLTNDLIVAQVVTSAGTGDVSSCTDEQNLLHFAQRTDYTPATGSPWVFEWYAEASGPLTSDKITCNYSVSTNFGLVVFGIANAYLASPYDSGSGDPCEAQGTPEVSCSVTTTGPYDMLLGLVASYHTSGSPPITPGGGFTQIRQEDVGPYGMAEFEDTGAVTGTYTVSANDSGVSGMAIIGDAVEVAPFVGWVSQMISNASLLNQLRSPLRNAHVWPVANCYHENVAGSWYVEHTFNLSGTNSSSSGYYQLTFPQTYTYTLHSKYYNPTVTQSLSSSGNCVTTDNYGNKYTVSNSHLLLYSNLAGYWNATLYLPATLSATNDYQQFGLPANGYSIAAGGVAFIHTSYAECAVGVTQGASQQVQNYVNILGYQQGYTTTGSVTSGTTASARQGLESSISLDYHTTGVVNESVGNFTYGEAQAYGNSYNLATDTVNFVDPDSTMPAVGNTSTSSTFERTVGANSTQWYNASNGGSYTSTAGLDLQVTLSLPGVSAPEWNGAGLSVNAVSLVDQTTASSDTSHAIDCSMQDTNSTYAYQFLVSVDSTLAASTDAINVHIWFLDACIAGTNGCP
jgi:hypothetical protein